MKLRTLLPPAVAVLLACGGAGSGGDPAPTPPADQDVRGVYALRWADDLTVRLDIGGAVQKAQSGPDGIVTFNAPDGSPLELDLAAWCADSAVTCPSEAWASHVAIDEDDVASNQTLHTLHVWDADTPGVAVSGAVNHDNDQFLLALDGDSGGAGNCGALSLSLAGGTFLYPSADDTSDTADDLLSQGVAGVEGGPVGIGDGKVVVGWLGVCAWEGLAVAATLSLETSFEAVRTGDLE